MNDENTKRLKIDTSFLQIAPLDTLKKYKDDRPIAVLYTDKIKIDAVLDKTMFYSLVSVECAKKLGCKIEIEADHHTDSDKCDDCGGVLLGRTTIPIRDFVDEDIGEVIFYVLNNMEEDMVLGVQNCLTLGLKDFFNPSLPVPYFTKN